MNIDFIPSSKLDVAGEYAFLMNENYANEEAGIWKPNAPRTNVKEVIEMILNNEIIAIEIDGAYIGGARMKIVDSEVAEFSMMCLHKDFRGKGISGKLIERMEKEVLKKNLKKIRFEVLTPAKWVHPKKEQLFSYYQSLGYKVTKTANFLDYYPQAKDFLATEVIFHLFEKDVDSALEWTESNIVTTTHLNANILTKLFSGKVSAVIVKGFSDKQTCDHMCSSLINLDSIEKYLYVISNKDEEKKLFLGVSRLGVPHSSTFGKEKDSKETIRYKSMVGPSFSRIRSFAHPHLSPIDKLRLVLDEQWVAGSNIGNFEGFKMYSGIVRYTDPEADLSKKAHVDSLLPDQAFDQQFAANIYIDIPEEEGELLLWSNHPRATPAQVHDKEYNEYLWSLDEKEALRIKPSKGDLVLFPTQLPHATNTFKSGKRISIQTFLALDKSGRIQLWC